MVLIKNKIQSILSSHFNWSLIESDTICYQAGFLYSKAWHEHINKLSYNLLIPSHGISSSSKLMTTLLTPIIISLIFFLLILLFKSCSFKGFNTRLKNIPYRKRSKFIQERNAITCAIQILRVLAHCVRDLERARIYLPGNHRVLSWSPLTDSSFSWFERTRFEWNMVLERFFKLSLTFDNTGLFFNGSNTV